MRPKRGSSLSSRPARFVAGLIGLAALAGTAPSSAAVEHDRLALAKRTKAVRAAIQAGREPAADRPSSWLAQWSNWSNWANWRN